MNDNKPRRGAPFKPDSEKHSERLGEIRVMAAQLESYQLVAELEGKSKSDWVRDTLDAQVKRTLKKALKRKRA